MIENPSMFPVARTNLIGRFRIGSRWRTTAGLCEEPVAERDDERRKRGWLCLSCPQVDLIRQEYFEVPLEALGVPWVR